MSRTRTRTATRRRLAKRIALGVGATSLVVALAIAAYVVSFADIGAAFAAKELCSRVFISGRSPAAVMREDLANYPAFGLFDTVRWQIDREARTVEAFATRIGYARAIHRPGLGCAIVPAAAEAASEPPLPAIAPAPPLPATDSSAIRALVDAAFDEPNPADLRRTRAVVVMHAGAIVAERYAPGFSADMPMPGWSMAKLAVNALVGALVEQKRIAIDARPPVREWSGADDPRRVLTLDSLLRLTDGLRFSDAYWNPRSDVYRMLFASADAGGYAAQATLEHRPGEHWRYSTAPTNIITRALRDIVAPGERYAELPRRLLFEPLGMSSAVLETDAAGHFVGSSFMYATARDWARLGQLYVTDGIWHERRILPAGWTRYTATPTEVAPHGEYGAHVWLKLRAASGEYVRTAPADTFHAAGHAGQFMSIVPSKRLVVVRLGHTPSASAWDQDAFVAALAKVAQD